MVFRRNAYLILAIIVAIISSSLWWISLKKSIVNSFEFVKLELKSDINFQAEKISKLQNNNNPVFQTLEAKNCLPYIDVPKMAPVPSAPIYIGAEKIPFENLEACTHIFRKTNSRSELGDYLKVHVGKYTKEGTEYFSLTLIFNDSDLKPRKSNKDYSLKDKDWFHLKIPDVSGRLSDLSNIYITFKAKKGNESFYRPFIYSSKTPIDFSSETALSNINNLSDMRGNLYPCNDKKVCDAEDLFILKLRMPIEKKPSIKDKGSFKVDITKPISLVWHNINEDYNLTLDTNNSSFSQSLSSAEVLKKVISNILDDILSDPEVQQKHHNTVEVIYQEEPYIKREHELSEEQEFNKYYLILAKLVGINKFSKIVSEDIVVRWPNVPNDFKVRVTSNKNQILNYWIKRVDQILTDYFWSFGSIVLLLFTFIIVIYRLRSITSVLQDLNIHGNKEEGLERLEAHVSKDEIGLLASGLHQGLKSEILRRKTEQEKLYLEESKRKNLERLSAVLYHDIVATYGPSLNELSSNLKEEEKDRHDYNLHQITKLAEGLRDGIKISEYKYDGSEEGSIQESIEPCLKRYKNKIKNRCSTTLLAERVISGEQLGFCIDQIVSNAMDFVSDDTPVEIEGGYTRKGLVILKIRNKGPQIPEDLMKEGLLFRFGESGRGSTGVGLWVTQKRMESMGGLIKAHNRPPYVEFELILKPL